MITFPVAEMGRVRHELGKHCTTVDRLNAATGRIIANAALIMALITAGIVVMRYGFGQGSIGAQESVLYLHATLFAGAAPALLADKHVRVDVFYRSMSERKNLGQHDRPYCLHPTVCALIFWLIRLCGRELAHPRAPRSRWHHQSSY